MPQHQSIFVHIFLKCTILFEKLRAEFAFAISSICSLNDHSIEATIMCSICAKWPQCVDHTFYLLITMLMKQQQKHVNSHETKCQLGSKQMNVSWTSTCSGRPSHLSIVSINYIAKQALHQAQCSIIAIFNRHLIFTQSMQMWKLQSIQMGITTSSGETRERCGKITKVYVYMRNKIALTESDLNFSLFCVEIGRISGYRLRNSLYYLYHSRGMNILVWMQNK